MKNFCTILICFLVCLFFGVQNWQLTNQINNILVQKERLESEVLIRKQLMQETHDLYQKIIAERDKIKSVEVDITAYTARKEECDETPWFTAIMEEPVPGWTVAVSHDLKYMLGKRVYIKGFGVRRVNDLMNSRYTKRVDILVPTVALARKIGVQTSTIVMLN